MDAIRHILNQLRKLSREMRERRQLPDMDWRRTCIASGVPLEKVTFLPDGSLSIELSRASITLPKCAEAFQVLAGYSLLADLEQRTDCKVRWDREQKTLVLSFGCVQLAADKFEHLYSLVEIYVDGDYAFASSTPTTMIDIGANVGFTSIYLAESNPEMSVEGCEPVEDSYRRALLNVKNNAHISGRITLHNFGLYSSEGVMQIKSSPQHRLRSSLVLAHETFDSTGVESIPVRLRRASEFVQEVRERHPGKRMVIKMDCEGSEYEILKDLEKSGALRLVSGFLLEWHLVDDKYKNALFMREYFIRNGFDLVIPGISQKQKSVGMAYAFRVKDEVF